jgi:hypothetical protein
VREEHRDHRIDANGDHRRRAPRVAEFPCLRTSSPTSSTPWGGWVSNPRPRDYESASLHPSGATQCHRPAPRSNVDPDGVVLSRPIWPNMLDEKLDQQEHGCSRLPPNGGRRPKAPPLPSTRDPESTATVSPRDQPRKVSTCVLHACPLPSVAGSSPTREQSCNVDESRR